MVLHRIDMTRKMFVLLNFLILFFLLLLIIVQIMSPFYMHFFDATLKVYSLASKYLSKWFLHYLLHLAIGSGVEGERVTILLCRIRKATLSYKEKNLSRFKAVIGFSPHSLMNELVQWHQMPRFAF